jgi:hypothetical protein
MIRTLVTGHLIDNEGEKEKSERLSDRGTPHSSPNKAIAWLESFDIAAARLENVNTLLFDCEPDKVASGRYRLSGVIAIAWMNLTPMLPTRRQSALLIIM